MMLLNQIMIQCEMDLFNRERLLTITPSDETPSALDISIAKCIVVLTNGSIEPDEEIPSNMFDEYILGGLAAIIRFPASHGCDKTEDISVVYNKYSLAVRRFAGRLSSGDAATVAEILRAFFRQPPGCWDIQNIEGISRSNANALRAIDCRLVVYVLQNVTSLASPPASLTYHLLVCVERLILECDRTEDLVSALLVDSIAKLIYVSIRNSPHLNPIQSQAFRLLVIIGHRSCLKWTPFQRNTLINSGLLEASREFFDNPSSIIQADVDLWVETLVRLDDANKVALMESRAVDSLLQWATRNWRGHEMTAPHIEQLRRLAESLGIKIDLNHDPTWFRELVRQKESLSKPVAR
ncbi:hypothetical protein ONZ45_g12455 [Pleurotus djamor]|nr:hypothetical protein ONZ45_g12455 [Pleurotus djamor]